MSDWGSRNRDREVVVTGAGVMSHFGDDLQTIESMLREGRNTPFTIYPPGVAIKSRCQIAGQYQGELTDAVLGVTKSQVGSSRVDLQACKLEYSIVSPK